MTLIPNNRIDEWKQFSELVEDHLRSYTIPQYGDKGEDSITSYSVETCMDNIKKYVKRYATNQRPGQESLDLFKLVHYACCAY
jgi:hypothetical protein